MGVKRIGRETDHSPASSAEVKNAWSYTSTQPYVFMAWCLLVVKHRGDFTLFAVVIWLSSVRMTLSHFYGCEI
jgi:hypothetical protein